MSSVNVKQLINRLLVMAMLVIWCSVLLSAADAQKPRFYIKLNGLGSWSTGGDFGDMIQQNELFFATMDETSTNVELQTKTDPFFRGYGGEIGFETTRFAVGFSAGYVQKNFNVTSHETGSMGAVTDYTRDFRLAAVPLLVMVHYKVLDSSFLRAYLTLGEGVYLGKYRDNFAQTYQHQELTFANKVVEGKRNSLGFLAGLTIDMNVSQNLGLFFEATYRLVQFKECKATDFYEDNTRQLTREGDLYYWHNPVTGETRFAVGAPNASQLPWEGLPAVLNLNGFSLRAGLKIIFGHVKKERPVLLLPPSE